MKFVIYFFLVLLVLYVLLKMIKCFQFFLRLRGDGDYENNNSFLNYLNVLREF